MLVFGETDSCYRARGFCFGGRRGLNAKPTLYSLISRRKLQRNSIAPFPEQAFAKTKKTVDCLSVVSSESPSVAVEDQHGLSQVEPATEVIGASFMPSLACNKGTHISKSELINGYSVVQECFSDEALKNCAQKTIDIDSTNDSCSSSKSNLELALASMKTEVDDTGECSSSSVRAAEVMAEDLSDKDICILLLKNQGVLERASPTMTSSMEDAGISSSSSCSRACKICGRSETTLNMLICDNCEEAFHTSCCNPRIKQIPCDEWFCHSCLKKKRKILKETTTRGLTNAHGGMGKYRNFSSKGESNPIAIMLRDLEPYRTGVRIGKGFQAEVPEWSGPIDNDVDAIAEPLEIDPSEFISLQGLNDKKASEVHSIGNWLQCKEVIQGIGDNVDGTVCGKWRRAPLFEVQTDDWECFCCVLWDPSHADCAVPQELETDQVLKQLKYIEMLRPRLAAKRQKLGRTKSGGSQDNPGDATNTCSPSV